MLRFPLLLAAACLLGGGAAAQTFEPPTMGWSSWNTYRVNINDSLICRQAGAMAANGLREAGYKYINIDDGFFGGRAADGRLLIHSGRFPRGLKPVVDHIHRLGFKAGIYSDAGRNTCGSFWDADTIARGVGFYGHDRQDADFYFREIGFDFIKVDFCGGDPGQNADHLDLDERERYTAIHQAILGTGRRDVRLNVCRWAFPGTWVRQVGFSWRISPDINASWASIKGIIARNRYLSAYASPGHYNDMDMLEIGRGLTPQEERTHMAMWSIMSSPLLIGCDLTAIPEPSLRLLTNPEVVALNQDSLGLQARLVKREGGAELYVKDVRRREGLTRAVALYNPTDTTARFCLRAADVDLAGRVTVRDLFARRDDGRLKDGERVVDIAPHDTHLYLLEGERRAERTFYEAECAWLEAYQCLVNERAAGTATYADDSGCSGGAKVTGLGASAGNFLEWRDVWSAAGGNYELTLRCPTPDARTLDVSVNGGAPVTLRFEPEADGAAAVRTLTVALRPGRNVVRLANTAAWGPDVDVMTLRRL